jgi:hypothetical protein
MANSVLRRSSSHELLAGQTPGLASTPDPARELCGGLPARVAYDAPRLLAPRDLDGLLDVLGPAQASYGRL